MNERIRINRRMMAWSDGHRVNVVPSEWRKVDDYGRTLAGYHSSMREGDEYLYGACSVVRDECRCREYEADRLWERGHRIDALNQMLAAASMVLPDEAAGFEFEDAQWLDPDETLYWHPNVREHLRLMRRCEDYCRREPRLRPLLESSRTYRDYRQCARSSKAAAPTATTASTSAPSAAGCTVEPKLCKAFGEGERTGPRTSTSFPDR